MLGKHKLNRGIKKFKKKVGEETIRIPGELGVTKDGQRLVEVPTRNGYVYVRLRNDLSELIQAYNNTVAPVYGLAVLVERDKVNKSIYKVVEVDSGRYQNQRSTPYLPRHGATHEFDPDTPGADPVWVWGRQIMPLGVIPSGSSGGPNVLVEPGMYYQNVVWHYAGGTGTQDLLPNYKPTGSNTARIILVYLDGDGNPQLLNGSECATNLTGTSQILPYLPALPATDDIPLAAVRLVTGTSVITWSNIYDVRPFVVSDGFIPTGTTAHTIYDDGSPLTDRPILDFVGAGLMAWDAGSKTIVSGTSAAVITDHGALTGLTDNDHPQYLLTGTQIDHGGLAGLLDNDHPQYALTGSAGGHVIQDDGVSQTQRANLNFIGETFVVYDDVANDATIISGTASAGDTSEIAAYYTIPSTLYIHSSSGTILHCDTKIYDTNNAVSTGTAWKFTAPNTGYYDVEISIIFIMSDEWDIGDIVYLALYKNGVYDRTLNRNSSTQGGSPTPGAAEVGLVGATCIYLEAGEYIQPLIYQASGEDPLGTNLCWIHIRLNSAIQGAKGDTGDTGAKGDTGDPGPPGSGMIVYDDLVYRTSGSSIDFGENLDVVATGSTAYVRSPTICATFTFSEGSQVFPHNTGVAIDYSVEVIDTHSFVTAGSDWKFLPTSAGYYVVSAMLQFQSTTTWAYGERGLLSIYKNGASAYFVSRRDNYTNSAMFMDLNGASPPIYLNGVSDYLSIYMSQTSGGNLTGSNGYVGIWKV